MYITHARGQVAARLGGPSRRNVVTASAAVAAALSSCSVPAPRRAAPTADPAPGMPITSSRRAQLMQILAHPDDDLYFMNPDTQRMLDSGTPLVCVYVTAGEADGVNRIPDQPRPAADKTAYSSARHQGLRQAYAALLGLPKFTEWQKGVATLRGDHRAEINTLANGSRRVELIFLNLAMHTVRSGRMGLPALWRDRELDLQTVVADDSPRTQGRVVRLRPAHRRTGRAHGPVPAHRRTDPGPRPGHPAQQRGARRKDSEQPGYSDHADHTAVASFSWAALVHWVAEATEEGGQVPGFVATAFRGYYNRHWPKNLPAERARTEGREPRPVRR